MIALMAVGLGDFTEERTCLIAATRVEDEIGLILRTLHLLADPFEKDPTRYWAMTVGQFKTGAFQPSITRTFPDGFPSTPLRVDFEAEIRVPRGSLLALRFTPSGPDVPPLTGVTVIPEFAPTSARK